jgi:hypothetical protein
MIYKIPVIWENWGEMHIEADSLNEACRKALGNEPLPKGEYIDDSCQLDLPIIEENYPNEEISKETLDYQNLL